MLGERQGNLGFADVDDADELCRRLLEPPLGLRSSTDHVEALELLARLRGTGELGDGLVALLLCTCRRWRRVTDKLVAAIEADGLLTHTELDELAEAFLAVEVEIVYPLGWVPPQWLAVEHTSARTQRRIAPPLRRWAASRALRADPDRLDELLTDRERLDPRGRGALILGLLDAGGVLGRDERRRLAQIGLDIGLARARRAALELVCELDGPDAALQRAQSDPDATVRAWRPSSPEPSPAQLLL
jgi:hypothetical protein